MINQYFAHILSLVTDNNNSCIIGRKNDHRNYFMINLHESKGPDQKSNSQPLGLRSDSLPTALQGLVGSLRCLKDTRTMCIILDIKVKTSNSFLYSNYICCWYTVELPHRFVEDSCIHDTLEWSTCSHLTKASRVVCIFKKKKFLVLNQYRCCAYSKELS